MRATLLNGNPLFRQTAGGLKFTSVSGKLTLDEAAVFGSTGVIRIIYLIDLCQLYHGYDQTDQLKNNACFIGLKHIIRGAVVMDSEMRNLKIAFQLAAPEDIFEVLRNNRQFFVRRNDRQIDSSGMTEAYYNMTFRKLLTDFSMDEIRNMYYDMDSSCETREDIPKSVFQLLVNYGMDIFEYYDEVPVVKRNRLMDFRQISLELGQDIFTTSYLAYRTLHNRIPEQVKFDWNKVVYTNDRRLQNILSEGIAENHFHLAGSTPVFFLSWVALMNNPHIIGNFFMPLYNSKDPFVENRNVSLSFSNDVRQLSWSTSLRYAAWIRVLLFQKIYGIEPVKELDFSMLDPDFSDLTELSAVVMKLKTLYGEKLTQPEGSSACLDYAVIKNDYFFDYNSANRLLSVTWG